MSASLRMTFLFGLVGFLFFACQTQKHEEVVFSPEVDLIQRIISDRASEFEVEILPSDSADWFELEPKGNKVVLRGNNGVSVASALYYYLTEYCHCQITWNGTNMNLPEVLPGIPQKVRKDVITSYSIHYTKLYDFNTGYVRSQGLQKDQNSIKLHEQKEAYYYQPLPKDKQNPRGDYELSESKDGRFWSKMDFEERPVSNIQKMKTDITITENDGEIELALQVDAPEGVEVTLELCFSYNFV